MTNDTKGWFFVAVWTTRPDGTTSKEIRGGGRPAMALAIGAMLALIYFIYMVMATPSRWEATGGGVVVLAVFVGLFVYFTERER